MPNRSHHRSRSSIDRVIDLLADLDDGQVSLLLEDFNNTTTSNVPVSRAIDFFETVPVAAAGKSPIVVEEAASPVSPPRAKRLAFPPRRKTSKRISSAPATAPSYDAERMRPKTAVSPTASLPTMPSVEEHIHQTPMAVSPTIPTVTVTETPSRPRGYKRISRPIPMLPNPLASPDLRELLAAYLCDTPLDLAVPSLSSSVSSSPSSMRSASAFRSLGREEADEEENAPWADLLEPMPAREAREETRSFAAALGLGFSGKAPTRKISGIFELMETR